MTYLNRQTFVCTSYMQVMYSQWFDRVGGMMCTGLQIQQSGLGSSTLISQSLSLPIPCVCMGTDKFNARGNPVMN